MGNIRKGKISNWFLCALLAVASCAHTHRDFNYSNEDKLSSGFTVRAEEAIDKNLMDLVVRLLGFALIDTGVYTQDQIEDALKQSHKYPVYIVKDRFNCERGVDGKCDGEFLPGSILRKQGSLAYVHNSCMSLSIFAHEMLHYFDYIISNEIDYLHMDFRIFKTGCLWKHKKNSWEYTRCTNKTVEHMIGNIIDYLCNKEE